MLRPAANSIAGRPAATRSGSVHRLALELRKSVRAVRSTVMPGLVPGIHVLESRSKKDVDGRDVQPEDALRASARPRCNRSAKIRPIDYRQVA
jgi:hypothetical protein